MRIVDEHAGVPSNEIHAHQETAKYVFVSSDSDPETYEHDHSRMSIASLEEHLRNAKPHKGKDEIDWPEKDEMHEHSRSVKNRKKNYASILNYNSPLAISMHEEAEIFFLGIEGSFKASAILSELMEHGTRGSVASVPSVSLWMDAPGLREFVTEIVKDRPIVIVPDGDWAKNGNVNAFSFFCKARLLSYGAKQVLVAAPPVDENMNSLWAFNPAKGEDDKCKGIDDFLGYGNGILSDLVARDVIPPNQDELRTFIKRELFLTGSGRAPESRAVESCVKVLTAISIFAGGRKMIHGAYDHGIIRRSLLSIGNAVAMSHVAVARSLVLLERIKAIEIDGDFAELKGDPALIDSLSIPVISVDSKFSSSLSDPVRLGDVFPFLY